MGLSFFVGKSHASVIIMHVNENTSRNDQTEASIFNTAHNTYLA